MPGERLQYLIDAIWQGSGATQQASVAIGNVGASARETSIAMAATQARSDLLGRKMSDLGREVAKGNLSVQEANQKYKEFENTLVDVGSSAGKSNTGLGSLITTYGKLAAALGSLTIIAKKSYEAFEEGAVLQKARSEFDNLAESINTTGDALLNNLGQATKGMATNAELIAASSDIISLKLSTNQEDVVRLANVTTRLGTDMQQLVQTFANNSIARLDALGLAVTDVKNRQQELVEAGYDLDSAFKMAVIEGLEARVELLGDASETTAGKIQQMKVAWRDASDAIKTGFAEGVVDSVDFDKLIEDMSQLTSMAADAGDEIGNVIKVLDALSYLTAPRQGAWLGDKWREFYAWLKTTPVGEPLITHNERMAAAQEKMIAATVGADRVLSNYGKAAALAAENVGDLAEEQANAGNTLATYAATLGASERELSTTTTRAVLAGREQAAAFMEQKEAAVELEEQMRALEEQAKQAARAYASDFREALNMAEDETVDFNGALFDQISALGASPDMLIQAGLALTGYGEEALGSALKVATMNQAIAEIAPLVLDGTMTVHEARDALLDLSAALDEDYTAQFNTDELLQAQEEARRLKRLLDIAAGSYTAHFSIIRQGGVPAQSGGANAGLSGGGGGDTEYASGTRGWERVPGPMGAPYPVTLHGGEMFNVVPNGYTVNAPPSSTTGTATIINIHGTHPNEVIRLLQDRGLLARDTYR